MNKAKGGLGRGLGSLLGGPGAAVGPGSAPLHDDVGTGSSQIDVVTEASMRIVDVAPEAITENPRQPRRHFDPTELADLASSIKEHGILQPLVVTELSPGKYELIAGERRLRASRSLHLPTVPVIVRPRTEDRQKLELALIENVQRHNLNPVEEALAFADLSNDFGLKYEEIGAKVGRSASYVANTLRLLDLPDHMRQSLVEGKISRSHGRTLLAESDPGRREALFLAMMNGGVSVREAEARTGIGTKRVMVSRGKDANVAALEQELREKLGTKVSIDLKGGSGKVAIHFYSKDELQELIQKLTK